MWAVGMGMSGICYAGMGLLPPNPSVALLTVLFSLSTFFILATVVAAPVIMGDIIDPGKRKFGVERGGLYLSLQGQITKAAGAIAAGAELIILGWAGFDATQTGADLTLHPVVTTMWEVGWAPSLGAHTQ